MGAMDATVFEDGFIFEDIDIGIFAYWQMKVFRKEVGCKYLFRFFVRMPFILQRLSNCIRAGIFFKNVNAIFEVHFFSQYFIGKPNSCSCVSHCMATQILRLV